MASKTTPTPAADTAAQPKAPPTSAKKPPTETEGSSLASLAAEDSSADSAAPSDLQQEVDKLRKELAASREEVTRVNALRDMEAKRAERHAAAAKSEKAALEREVDELKAKLAAPRSGAVVEPPANLPENHVLVRYKAGIYGGPAYSLKGERHARVRGPFVGYFPKAIVDKLPGQFESVTL